jgi:hypothetical protein
MAWTLPTGDRIVSLNGTTHVTLIAAPGASSQRLVLLARAENLDSVSQTVAFVRNKNGTRTDLLRRLVQPGGALELPTPFDLVATDESLEGVMEAAHSTTAPRVTLSVAEQA